MNTGVNEGSSSQDIGVQKLDQQTLVNLKRKTTKWVTNLTNCMEQSPSWEANRFSASQEIPQILLNPKIYYRV
jgi:hypothetical protein